MGCAFFACWLAFLSDDTAQEIRTMKSNGKIPGNIGVTPDYLPTGGRLAGSALGAAALAMPVRISVSAMVFCML